MHCSLFCVLLDYLCLFAWLLFIFIFMLFMIFMFIMFMLDYCSYAYWWSWYIIDDMILKCWYDIKILIIVSLHESCLVIWLLSVLDNGLLYSNPCIHYCYWLIYTYVISCSLFWFEKYFEVLKFLLNNDLTWFMKYLSVCS